MEARYLTSVYNAADLPRDRKVEIAVAGKSNVGKSSLLNRLVKRRGLAKTSQTPGKTRCLNYFVVEPDKSASFYLVDLPGYGYAKVSQTMRKDWAGLIEAYLNEPDRPAGLIALFDARREPTSVDEDWLAWLGLWGRPFLVVLTKSDKVSGNARAQAIRRWTLAGPAGAIAPVTASALTGEGTDKIWQWMDGVRRRRPG
ncbi:MAG: ribosome biogenesis GTP-binding protein YihA/YsxC [Candidatus Zixiibacteriota bacterium]